MSTTALVYLVLAVITALAGRPLLRHFRSLRTTFAFGAVGLRWWLAASLLGLAAAIWALVALTTLQGWLTGISTSRPKMAIEVIWPLGMLIYGVVISLVHPPPAEPES